MSHARRALALALVLCMLCSIFLTGCHGKKESTGFSVPEEFDTSKNYELTFWAKNDTNKTQTDIYAKAIESFEKACPNIKVKIRLYTNYGDIYNDVITNISTGTTPNVCITYPDHIATYITGDNVVAPLDELIADEKYGLGGSEVAFDSPKADEVVPRFLEEGKIGGVTYAIPFMRSTEACYINKTFVEKLGFELPDVLTWDFIWKVTAKAMEKDADGSFKVNGQNILIPFIYKSTDNMMIQMLKQAGAGYSTDDGQIELFNDTTRDILKTLGEKAKSREFSTFKISSYPANFLNAGQCIFAVDSTAGSTWMGTHAEHVDIAPDKIVEFETAVRMVPQIVPFNADGTPASAEAGSGDSAVAGTEANATAEEGTSDASAAGTEVDVADATPSDVADATAEAGSGSAAAQTQPWMISQGPSVCVFNKTDPQEVLASWLFAQYLLTNEVQIAYSETEGYIPVTLKAQQSQEYQDYLAAEGSDNSTHYDVKIEASKLMIDHVDDSFTTPVFNGSASLREAAGQLIEDTCKSARRKKDISDEYLDQLFAETSQLYRLDQISAGASATAGGGLNRDLGPLPPTAKALLGVLLVTWVGIAIYALSGYLKVKKRKGS